MNVVQVLYIILAVLIFVVVPLAHFLDLHLFSRRIKRQGPPLEYLSDKFKEEV